VELGGGQYTAREIEKGLERLATLGSHVELGAFKLLAETNDQKMASMAAAFLFKLDTALAVDECFSLLGNPKVSDVAKVQICRYLTAVGLDVGDFMDATNFRDAAKLAEESLQFLLTELQQRPSILGNVLEDFATIAPEMQLAYILDLAHTSDSRAVPLLWALARGDDEVLVSEAVRGLGVLGTPLALGALQELCQTVKEPFLLRLIEREARKLSFKGVKPEAPPILASGIPYEVLVTGIDGKGCRIVWISRYMKGKRGKLMAASFLLCLEDGVRDCYGTVELTRQESHEMRASIEEKYPAVVGDLDYASALLRDALQRNRDTNTHLPPQWAFWSQLFAPYPVTPKGYEFLDEGETFEPKGVETTELLTMEELTEWYEEDVLVYDAAEQILAVNKRFRSSKGKKRAADEILSRFASALFAPRLGEIIRRLDFTGDFLRRRGKINSAKKLSEISRALRAGQPPEENAFLRNLLTLSVRVAEHNLRSGFDLRRRPDGQE